MSPWELAWVSALGAGIAAGLIAFAVALWLERRNRRKWDRRRERRPGFLSFPPYDHEGKP